MRERTKAESMLFLVDFYQGAYGPTVRIDTISVDGLIWLRDIFADLAKSNDGTIRFDKIVSGRITNISALELRNITTPEVVERNKEIICVEETAQGPSVYWKRNREGWLECSGLVTGMIELGKPCHQYAGIQGEDDAIIEITFMERPPGMG